MGLTSGAGGAVGGFCAVSMECRGVSVAISGDRGGRHEDEAGGCLCSGLETRGEEALRDVLTGAILLIPLMRTTKTSLGSAST